MITRNDLLCKAVDDCLKETYTYVTPNVSWECFLVENKVYSDKYNKWKILENRPSILEYCGPRPCEFYYLPKDILKNIVDNYIYAYKIDNQQELLDTIEILKNYCKEPIVDKYIDDWTDETGFHHPGYRSYDYPDNLEKEITKILGPEAEDNPYHVHKICDKFFEFLDMAGDFYNWNRELNSFNISVYLGPSPNTNKQVVIDNWKKYRNKDIEINEEQIKREYYDDEYDDKELD